MKKTTKSKKKSAKSTPKKKSQSKKSTAVDTQKKKLLSQLNKITKELNGESLAFLVKQALVLQHNISVNELNRNLIETARTGKSIKKAEPSGLKFEIKEAEDGSHFIIVINTERNFFTLDEMRKLVKICHASKDEKDASKRLFNWLSRERGDVIKNSPIEDSGDPVLEKIYNLIIKRYTVK